jgi:hypothetical protein
MYVYIYMYICIEHTHIYTTLCISNLRSRNCNRVTHEGLQRRIWAIYSSMCLGSREWGRNIVTSAWTRACLSVGFWCADLLLWRIWPMYLCMYVCMHACMSGGGTLWPRLGHARACLLGFDARIRCCEGFGLCIYVCMCVCMCICALNCTCLCIYIHTYTETHAHMPTKHAHKTRKHMHTPKQSHPAYFSARILWKLALKNTYIHTYMYTHMYKFAMIHIRTLHTFQHASCENWPWRTPCLCN